MVAATLEQVLAAGTTANAKLDALAGGLATANSKLDTLSSQMGMLMALQDDLEAATVTLQEETASLADSNDKLAAVLEQLRGSNVDPAVVTAFEDALGQHKTSVDKITALANPPAGP